LHTPNVLRLIY